MGVSSVGGLVGAVVGKEYGCHAPEMEVVSCRCAAR